jgi:hypothetical protein
MINARVAHPSNYRWFCRGWVRTTAGDPLRVPSQSGEIEMSSGVWRGKWIPHSVLVLPLTASCGLKLVGHRQIRPFSDRNCALLEGSRGVGGLSEQPGSLPSGCRPRNLPLDYSATRLAHSTPPADPECFATIWQSSNPKAGTSLFVPWAFIRH